MTRALVHRGPDSSGRHRRGSLELGARRLSIVGIESGDQPIYNETGELAIVFNGEIYNYRELQRHLRERGHELSTESDSEVVLHLFEEYGAACVEHLRGMFAFAIDTGDSLLLARDRLGIKPLYYALPARGGPFLFASEIKALLRCPEVGAELDFQAFVDSVVCSHPVGARTLFEDVRCLEPGSVLEVRETGRGISLDRRRYHRPRIEPDPSITLADAEEALFRLLRETVSAHLTGEVEVCLLLSGGLDSSLLAALMAECLDRPFAAFTTAIGEDHSDLVNARAVAAGLGLEHETLAPTFEDYLSSIPQWIALRETTLPSLNGLSALPLVRRIGERSKVCLCGEGSDEIFGGYPEFYGRLAGLERFRHNLSRVRSLGYEPSPAAAEPIETAFAHPKGSDDFLLALFRYNQGDLLVRQHLDFHDQVGMAAGVEIRVPFMDHLLVELANRLPLELKVHDRPRIGKYVLRRVADRRFAGRLGDASRRPKLGMPNACGAHRRRFDALCRELLPSDYRRRHELGALFPSRERLLLFELHRTIFGDSRGEVPAGLDVVEFIRSRRDAVPPVRTTVPAANLSPGMGARA